MARINVKPDKLDRVANKLSSVQEDLNHSANKMNHARGTVENAWKSQYTATYVQEMEVVRDNIRKIAKKSDELARMMHKTASEIRRVEEENRQMFHGGGGGR